MRRIASLGIVFFLLPAIASAQRGPQIEKLYDFFPEIEPYHSDFLKVSDGHEIYFEECGNPLRPAVMVLHGGPGGGSYPTLRRYHHPEKYRIVLFDQRGAGKSKPHNELEGNTTQKLVEDMEKLRVHLKIDKMQLFGGSWGSTLALAYAEKYPQNVSSMVLRGIFTATKRENDHFYHGPVGDYFPEVYARLKAVIPDPERLNYPEQLLHMLRDGDETTKKKAALAWATYETKVAALEATDEEVESIVKQFDNYNFSLIENYYMANNCFLEEGQLLKEAKKLAGIPTVICHGRYDVICPPRAAYDLHKALPGSRLVWVEAAGHSGSSPPMRSALIQAVISLEGQAATPKATTPQIEKRPG